MGRSTPSWIKRGGAFVACDGSSHDGSSHDGSSHDGSSRDSSTRDGSTFDGRSSRREKTQETSSRFVLIFGLLFAFQPNSEVMQPATCFHDQIPKFGTTEADNVVNDSIPLDIADNMFNTNANG